MAETPNTHVPGAANVTASVDAATHYLRLLGRSDVSPLFAGNRVLDRFPNFPQVTIELGGKAHQFCVTSNQMVDVIRHATRIWDAQKR